MEGVTTDASANAASAEAEPRGWQLRLAAGETLVLDGGTGSELRRRGMPPHPHAWSALAALTHYDLLRSVHSDYIAAGADVVIVNTFAATRFVLEAAGAGDELETIVRRSVAAAREARDAAGRGDVAIAGSISCLPPRFDARAYPSADRESAAYRELAELLAAAGVDLIALEMLQDATHGGRACAAVRDVGLPFWLGVSVRTDTAANELVAYDFPERPFASFVDALLAFSPSVVNVMHTPPAVVTPALAELRRRFTGLLGAYPEREVPIELARTWQAAGARVLGGCCGTTPADIAPLAAALADLAPVGLRAPQQTLRRDGQIAVDLDREPYSQVDEHTQQVRR